jgi:NhaP-type Na+/H+ or K+/H+ antiporter
MNPSSNVGPINENIHILQNEMLSAKTLIAVAIVFLYTISSPIMHKFKFYVLHESGMSMLIGLLVTFCAMIINPETSFANTLYFDDAIFFNFILPPIIFSAGYNLKRKSFFKYIAFTLLFGIIGTIISFLIISSLSYCLNYLGFFISNHKVINLSIQEILLFSCVISSTDTLAALTFIKEENDPKLFSILFGEGVFNDAVAIVLYKIITDFAYSKEEFTSKTPFYMFGSFLKLFLFSLIFGLFIGLICTLFLKKMKNFKLHRVQECSIIIFFAFFSYTISELIGLSPIISLLFSAMFMSHYSFYNLSFQAREESSIVSKIMSNIAEAFVFTYLGLTFLSLSNTSFSFTFLIAEFMIVIFSRYVSVYSLSWFVK